MTKFKITFLSILYILLNLTIGYFSEIILGKNIFIVLIELIIIPVLLAFGLYTILKIKNKIQYSFYVIILFILTWLALSLPLFVSMTIRYLDKSEFIKACIIRARNGKNNNDNIINYKEYCSCAFEKIHFNNKMDIDKIKKETENINGVMYNEVFLSCLEEAKINKQLESTNYGQNSKTMIDTIPLLKVFGANKVKVVFGDYPYYFIFDTGASDILVSEKFIEELKSNGVIKTINYLKDNVTYITASGESLICKQIMLTNIKIGKFTIDSAPVGVYKGDIDFLLGASFLKKFKNYSVIENNSYLILER